MVRQIGIVAPVKDPDADDEAWREARERAAIIARLHADTPAAAQLTISEAARQLGVDRATVYRWRRAYEAERRVSALLPRQPGRPEGAGYIDDAVEAIISEEIEAFYLRPERPTLSELILRIHKRCHAEGQRRPNWRTVRMRVARVDARRSVAMRHGSAAARQAYAPVPGEHSPAGPLDVVQIDHTVVDVIVVDEATRQPVDRPVATFAIDVATRMVLGFYLALDQPSTLRAGVTMAQAVFEKSSWLSERAIDLPWPAAGLPRAVHVDNAGEFKSSAFTRALQDVGVEIIYRPVGRPRYGGHVERLIGTQMGAVHMLRGTTFSSVSSKGEYPSEARASMTLSELERWMAYEILGKYHHRIHAALERPPVAVWEEATAGAVLHQPRRPAEFLASLLPFEWRQVRRDGVHLFGIRYWDDVLVPHVGRLRSKVQVKYDPRDLSAVFVRLPDGHHMSVRYANLSRPPISLWELTRANARLRAQGRAEVNEQILFASIDEQRRIEDEALSKSKAARRARSVRPEGPIAQDRTDYSPAKPLRGIDTGNPDIELLPTEFVDDRWQ